MPSWNDRSTWLPSVTGITWPVATFNTNIRYTDGFRSGNGDLSLILGPSMAGKLSLTRPRNWGIISGGTKATGAWLPDG
jgi:hypothetical protein